MTWEWAADDSDPPASNAGLDAELERAVTSGEALAYVVLFTGANPGRIYAIKRSAVVIGRADEADVHIADASVSSSHARIINRSGGFEILDLVCTNGTYVGGKRVAHSALRNGDHVTVGSVEFMFMLDHPTNATIRLPDSFKRAPTTNSMTALVPTGQPLMAPRISVSLPASHGVPLPRSERGERGADAPSLADMVYKIAKEGSSSPRSPRSLRGSGTPWEAGNDTEIRGAISGCPVGTSAVMLLVVGARLKLSGSLMVALVGWSSMNMNSTLPTVTWSPLRNAECATRLPPT